MPNDFRILVVCTGNVCRSPLAEALLRDRLRGTDGVRIASAGTDALVGQGMFGATRLMASQHGVEGGGQHRARQLEAAELEAADLVLVMTVEHRKRVVELSPRSTRRVFTLREFARLAAATTDGDLALEMVRPGMSDEDMSTAEKLKAAVLAVALSRGTVAPLKNASDLDVQDPYLQVRHVHEASTREIVAAVDTVIDLFSRALGASSLAQPDN